MKKHFPISKAIKTGFVLLCFLTILEIAFILYKSFTITPSRIYQSTVLSDETYDLHLLDCDIPVYQDFSVRGERIHKIVVYFEKLDPLVNGDIRVALLDSDGEIYNEWTPPVSAMEDPLFYICFFYDDKFLPAEDNYTLEICLQNNTEGSLALKCRKWDDSDNWVSPLCRQDSISEHVAFLDVEYEKKDFSILHHSIIIWLFACALTSFFVIFVSVLISQRMRLLNYLKHVSASLKKCLLTYPLAFPVGAVTLVSMLYFSTWDMLLLLILFGSSYITGTWICRTFKVNNMAAECGIGLLVLGVIISYILHCSLGGRGIYLVLLMLPLIAGRKKLVSVIVSANTAVKNNVGYTCALSFFFILYLILGCEPIGANDALVKHLPISVYAADLGTWYNNIIENVVVYSESTLLSYTYTTLFTSFGCFKAITLFNVLLFFSIFGMAVSFAVKIYDQVNKWLLLFAFFTTPYILELTTTFTVDILPIFIVFILLSLLDDLTWSSIEPKLPLLAFSIGCAVYTKLTILSSVLALCLLAAGSFIVHLRNGRRNRCCGKYILAVLKLLPVSLLCLTIPFAVSFIQNWYYTGNPFSITAYNNIFHSPYFNDAVFDRPFRNNAMGAGPLCFWQVTFDTAKMVEADSGAMGILWLLVILIPIAVLLFRNRKLLVWLVCSLAGLEIAGIIVGNLRYVLSLFLILEILIIVSLSLFLEKIKRKSLRILYCFLITAYIILPNLYFLSAHTNWNKAFQPDSTAVECPNWEILQYVPEGSKVLSFTDSYKGTYSGFYFPLSWYNDYTISQIYNGRISFHQFLQGFDYAICQKTIKLNQVNKNWPLAAWIRDALASDTMEEILQTPRYILFRVNHEQTSELVLSKSDFVLNGTPEVVQTTNADKIMISLQADSDAFHLDLKSHVVIEIACWDKERNLVEYIQVPNIIDQDYLSHITTGWIALPEEVCFLDVKLKAPDEQIPVSNLSIYKSGRDTILNQFISDYYNRTLLKPKDHVNSGAL